MSDDPVRGRTRRIGRVMVRGLQSFGRGHGLTLLAAALLCIALSTGDGIATQRGILFVMAPLGLLAELHGRTGGYLHAPLVGATLHLPLAPRPRFAAAARVHLPRLALALVWLTFAVVAATPAGPSRWTPGHAGLVADLLALGWMAGCTEALGPALSAWLGRRLPPASPGARLQVALGGGWTLPEAVVHLYAPACALGLAVALAMPLQLGIDRWVDGAHLPNGLVVAAITGLALALVLRIVAPHLYGRGLFESVPWLLEAVQTLAGPPVPEPLPRWILRVRDPALRLWLIRHQRLTPLPRLRYWTLLSVTGLLAWSGRALGPGQAVLVVAVVSLWLWPALPMARQVRTLAPMLAALPLRPRHRTAVLLLLLPPTLCLAVLAWRSGLAL